MKNPYHGFWNTTPDYANLDSYDSSRSSFRNDICVTYPPQRTLTVRTTNNGTSTGLSLGKATRGTIRINEKLLQIMAAHTTLDPYNFTHLAEFSKTTQPISNLIRCFRLARHTRVEAIPAKPMISSQQFMLGTFNNFATLQLCVETHRQSRTWDNHISRQSRIYPTQGQ